MNILLSQDGYEAYLLNLQDISFQINLDIKKHRGSYFYYLKAISIALFVFSYSKVSRKRVRLYYSSNEADEFLMCLYWLSKGYRSTVTFIRLMANDREQSFVLSGDLAAVPKKVRQLDKFLSFFGDELVEGIINDLGSKSYRVKVVGDELKIPSFMDSHKVFKETRRIIVLLEPKRSQSVLDLSLWHIEVKRAVQLLVSNTHYTGPIYVKAHPFQRCEQLDYENIVEIDKGEDIFSGLSPEDVIVGTFGSVIDVAPNFCRVYSIAKNVELQCESILRRVKQSGAKFI